MTPTAADLTVLDFTENGPLVAASAGNGNLAMKALPDGVTSVVVELVPNGALSVTLQVLDGSGQGSVTVDPNGIQVYTNLTAPTKFTVSNIVGGNIGFNLQGWTGNIGSLKVHAHPNIVPMNQSPVAYGATSIASGGGQGGVQPRLVGGGLSAGGTQNQVVLQLGPLNQVLDIIMATEDGIATATLEVEVSVDNQSWDIVDNFAADTKIVKHYNNNTVGAVTAVTPPAFPFIRVTAGAASGGKKTSLKVAAK